MDDETLDACPFCGGLDLNFSSNGHENLFVTCLQCGTEGPVAESTQGAADLWNNRVTPKVE